MTHKKARLLTAVAGVAFADFLIFFQLGVRDALYDSQVSPYNALNGDLFIINKLSDNIASIKSFSRGSLYQAAGADGVDAVTSLYIGSASWRNPDNLTTRQIFIYGIDPVRPAIDLPAVSQNIDQLKFLNRALYDRGGLPLLGDVAKRLQDQGSLSAQINDLEIEIVGLFFLGSSFSAEGNLVTSDSTFLRLFSQRTADNIDVGVIQVAAQSDITQVQSILNDTVPDNLLVLTLAEFENRERLYWENGSAIGFTFTLGVIVGLIVGAVIVYQILYTEVSDHLPEYATLKAMGYSNRFLVIVVLQEAIVLAVLGFVPGFLFSNGLYILFQSATLLPIGMNVSRAAAVFVLTLSMCAASGLAAVRKLHLVDPADIF